MCGLNIFHFKNGYDSFKVSTRLHFFFFSLFPPMHHHPHMDLLHYNDLSLATLFLFTFFQQNSFYKNLVYFGVDVDRIVHFFSGSLKRNECEHGFSILTFFLFSQFCQLLIKISEWKYPTVIYSATNHFEITLEIYSIILKKDLSSKKSF